jgi:hypothetical protein
VYHQPKVGDSQAVAEWRKRMATDQAKERCKERAATPRRAIVA